MKKRIFLHFRTLMICLLILGQIVNIMGFSRIQAEETTNQETQTEEPINQEPQTDDSTSQVPQEEEIVKKEFQAVWISYLEFNDRLKDPKTGKLGFTEERFQKVIDEMFDNVVKLKMNAVVVHVRPFGDAMYPSKHFTWSRYISGTQGVDPGFDPLHYMILAAHRRNLEFHAWINPYRVTTNSTDVKLLAADNKARIWRTDKTKSNDRNILTYGGQLYYNPAVKEVQNLIKSGIDEIVKNYSVDGIHFDDYFYPALGTNYQKKFDHKEYEVYVKECEINNVKPKSIANWRRGNVNTLVKRIYKSIKNIDPAISFGISPGGFLDYLSYNDRYYVDVKTWLSKPGYVDYVCPQLYWSFDHSRYPFQDILNRWLEIRTNEDVKIYVGMATYKMGSNLEPAWKKDSNILKKMIEYSRSTEKVDGFMHFRYDFFYKKATQNGVKRMLNIL